MSALAPLRHAPFRFLVLGRTINMIGNTVAPMALAFGVLDLTQSARDLGLVVAARSATNVLFVLFGGVLADRLPRKFVMIASALLAALTQGTVAALFFTGQATVPLLMGIGALNGAVAAFSFPAVSAIQGQVVPDEIRQQANALNRLSVNLVGIGGAAAGGILVATVGSAWSIAIDSFTFALSAVFFALIRVTDVRDTSQPRESTLHELRVGWHEFASRTWLWAVVLGFTVLNSMLAGAIGVLGPTIAGHTFGKAGWGVASAAELAGLAVGGLIVLRLKIRRFLLAGVLGMSGVVPFMLVLGAAPYLPLVIAVALLAGFGIEIFGVAWETSMQRHVPADLLARVYSWDILGSIVAIPIGQVVAGSAADALGTEGALIAAAVLSALAIVGMVLTPAVRDLDNTPATSAAEPGPAQEAVEAAA
jgi:MFS family permease